ncbi:ImmA/IrrE family metallo-endopeptidase [Sphaerotilus mobilis]|nr:XRE family transcriptional regulator [Sphaerotilus mobilis]
MANAARINPQQLAWMRERAGLTVDAAARASGVPMQRFEAWESGDAAPTLLQAVKLAAALHAPLGYLFLSQAPDEALPIPDLRTVDSHAAPRLSLNLQDTIRTALQRQAWYADHLRETGDDTPLPFVGRMRTQTRAELIAADMHATLTPRTQQPDGRPADPMQALIEAAERCGVLVMRSGCVGSDTHRTLDVAEFRGFAIVDPLAPLVFVNLADAPTARLFTLVHELAHIWIGSSGVSDLQPGNHRAVERLCNAVAGEFLAPGEGFIKRWNAAGDVDVTTRAARIAKALHVSAQVVMRRALDLSLISQDVWREHYLAELQRFRDQVGGAGNYYRNVSAKNSKRFARAVLAEALSGRLLLRDAGQLLGMQPSKLQRLAKELDT